MCLKKTAQSRNWADILRSSRRSLPTKHSSNRPREGRQYVNMSGFNRAQRDMYSLKHCKDFLYFSLLKRQKHAKKVSYWNCSHSKTTFQNHIEHVGKTKPFKLHDTEVGHVEQTHPATHLLSLVRTDRWKKLGHKRWDKKQHRHCASSFSLSWSACHLWV